MAEMKGLAAVLARLQRIPVEVREAVGHQVQQEADDMVAAIKRAAPVSEFEDHPGQLRDSIESYKPQEEARALRRRIIVGARDPKGKLFGSYVEFGHTKEGGGYVPASPFFWPTYRARRKGMRRRIAAAARKALKAKFPKVT